MVWSSAFAVPPLIALSLAVEGWAAISAALWLDESLPLWKLSAAALVMAGLALNLLWPRLRAALAARG